VKGVRRVEGEGFLGLEVRANEEQDREHTLKSAVLQDPSVNVPLGLLTGLRGHVSSRGILDLQVPGTPRVDPVRSPWYANGTRRGVATP
jgi:hypothetical protein